MIPVELTIWILILTGVIGLTNIVLMALVMRLFYRSLDLQKDILNQIRHLANAQAGILELEDDDYLEAVGNWVGISGNAYPVPGHRHTPSMGLFN